MSSWDKTIVGSLVLEEEAVFERQYETASWYTHIKVKAGSYPVYMLLGRPAYAHNEVHYELPGVVVKSHFVNRVFSFSRARVNEDIGKPDIYRRSTPIWSFARSVATGCKYYSYDKKPYHYTSRMSTSFRVACSGLRIYNLCV